LTIGAFSILPPSAVAVDPDPVSSTLRDSAQLLVVIAADWNATTAEMHCFERADGRDDWTEVHGISGAIVGRAGLAWGTGLHRRPPDAGPEKREGDDRTPAGAFRLVEAFGFASKREAGITRFPYRQVTEKTEGVDDPASRYYNRVVEGHGIGQKDWHSSEQMRRVGERYRWGVVVAHNWDQVPGRGSCIFLHVWPCGRGGTSGCTALPGDSMERVIRWLDRRKNPILVQLPRAEYAALRERWRLPRLNAGARQ
jgi:D-alanyl-D-alanine dipeptidase